jgi:hypothetical protein
LTTPEVMFCTIENSCTCEVINNPQIGYEPSDECFGCTDDSIEDFKENIFPEWFARNDFLLRDANQLTITVNGSNLNWNHVKGHGWIEADAQAIINLLDINTQWKLHFTLDGKDLRCSRYSHDEYGALFEFTIE